MLVPLLIFKIIIRTPGYKDNVELNRFIKKNKTFELLEMSVVVEMPQICPKDNH